MQLKKRGRRTPDGQGSSDQSLYSHDLHRLSSQGRDLLRGHSSSLGRSVWTGTTARWQSVAAELLHENLQYGNSTCHTYCSDAMDVPIVDMMSFTC